MWEPGTFLIRKSCLNSFSWGSPAQQAKPKVCLYHRNPLSNHRESWEFNLSWRFLSSHLCFAFFLHYLFPRSALNTGYEAMERMPQKEMEGEGDGHVAVKLCFLQPFLFKDLFIYLLCVCMLISVSLCKPHICRCPRRPEGITCFRTGVTGSTRNETHPPARAARAFNC